MARCAVCDRLSRIVPDGDVCRTCAEIIAAAVRPEVRRG